MTSGIGLAVLLAVTGCANTAERSGQEACTPPSLFEVFWVNDLGIGADDFSKRIEGCNTREMNALKARIEKDSAAKRQDLAAQARAGDAGAQYRLGMSYYPWTREDWKQHPEDAAKAARWLCRSANQGFAQAEFRLGYLSEKGYAPIKKNAGQAYVLYGRAVRHGDKRAADFKTRLGKKMTPGQIEKAKALFGDGTPAPRDCAAD